MDPTGSNEPDRRYLHIKFSQRWHYHREKIQKMYIDDGLSTKDIALKMKEEYMFDADVRQYKYHINKWGLNKNVSSTAKEQAIKALEKRQRKGTATGEVRYKGEPVDKKKLRRHLQAMSRVEPKLSSDAIIFARSDFLTQAHWAMLDALDHQSPAGSTPSAISVLSLPQMPTRSSPATVLPPNNAATPTTIAIRDRTWNNRATSLLEGRYGDFLGNMSTKERRISIAWLDQFWYFSFKTFKHWGKGPRYWTSTMLQFDDLLNMASSPNTPGAITSSHEHASSVYGASPDGNGHLKPVALCRWSIHISDEALFYGEAPSTPTEPSDQYDVNNPDGWPSWPKESPPANPVTHLQEALHTNAFSNIEVDQLPLSSTQVAKAAARSPEELQVESVGSDDFKLKKLYPFHLAASYLDGARSCCGIMNTLVRDTTAHNKIKSLFTNNLGHTVLDALMMTILKGHSSCSPEVVDGEFRGQQQFAGAEVDLCGRWDADSPCIRHSNASSRDHIPHSWKHMFCHTSVQAICHSITSVYRSSGAPDIGTRSGLFVKSCVHCGNRLEPLPLHTLVLVTFYLAQNSCEGETLFGSLACLVCLLVHEADPLMTAEISVQALLGADEGERCTHQALDPLQLAECVPHTVLATWSKELRLGWDVFLAVLHLAQHNRRAGEPYERYYDYEHLSNKYNRLNQEQKDVYNCLSCKHGSRRPDRLIWTLWASIQTEYLTYRRLDEGEPWMSENFSMISIIEDIRCGRDFASLPLINRQMMEPHCICGRFIRSVGDADYYDSRPTTEDACAFYFSNLEVWNRSTFLPY
ncbi:uncharacterized protein PG986_012704 [Apiospora aurea]|uniref:Clr5 domain-containing protein n=1 Tax=Apiospora aurea TaxID=335848 RepID=A0ABR1Q0R2_9PEZI